MPTVAALPGLDDLSVLARVAFDRLAGGLDPVQALARLEGASDREVIRLGLTDDVGLDPQAWHALVGAALHDWLSGSRPELSSWVCARLGGVDEVAAAGVVSTVLDAAAARTGLSPTDASPAAAVDAEAAGQVFAGLTISVLPAALDWVRADSRVSLGDSGALAARVVLALGRRAPNWMSRFDALAGAGRAHDGAFWLPLDATDPHAFSSFLTGVSLDGLASADALEALRTAVRSWDAVAASGASTIAQASAAALAAGAPVAPDSLFASTWSAVYKGEFPAYTDALEAFTRSLSTPRAPLPRSVFTSVSGYTGMFVDRSDPTGVLLGELTDCCQSFEGAGRWAAQHGQCDPRGSFFVVRDPSGRVVAQSWLWLGFESGACFDNIELLEPTLSPDAMPAALAAGLDARRASVREVYVAAATALAQRFTHVTVGEGYTDSGILEGLVPAKSWALDASDLAYTDARRQRLLAVASHLVKPSRRVPRKSSTTSPARTPVVSPGTPPPVLASKVTLSGPFDALRVMLDGVLVFTVSRTVVDGVSTCTVLLAPGQVRAGTVSDEVLDLAADMAGTDALRILDGAHRLVTEFDADGEGFSDVNQLLGSRATELVELVAALRGTRVRLSDALPAREIGMTLEQVEVCRQSHTRPSLVAEAVKLGMSLELAMSLVSSSARLTDAVFAVGAGVPPEMVAELMQASLAQAASRTLYDDFPQSGFPMYGPAVRLRPLGQAVKVYGWSPVSSFLIGHARLTDPEGFAGLAGSLAAVGHAHVDSLAAAAEEGLDFATACEISSAGLERVSRAAVRAVARGLPVPVLAELIQDGVADFVSVENLLEDGWSVEQVCRSVRYPGLSEAAMYAAYDCDFDLANEFASWQVSAGDLSYALMDGASLADVLDLVISGVPGHQVAFVLRLGLSPELASEVSNLGVDLAHVDYACARNTLSVDDALALVRIFGRHAPVSDPEVSSWEQLRYPDLVSCFKAGASLAECDLLAASGWGLHAVPSLLNSGVPATVAVRMNAARLPSGVLELALEPAERGVFSFEQLRDLDPDRFFTAVGAMFDVLDVAESLEDAAPGSPALLADAAHAGLTFDAVLGLLDSGGSEALEVELRLAARRPQVPHRRVPSARTM